MITYLFSICYSKNAGSSLLIFSILFGTIEFARGIIFTGFPWNLIAYSFSKSIYFIQILSIIGTYSFNLFCISLFSVPALFILKKTRKEIIVCLLFISFSVGFIIFGNLKNNEFNSSKDIQNSFTIRAISSNISLDRFYKKRDELKIINELIFLSNPKKKKPTIFLWPEGIVPDSNMDDMIFYKDLFLNNFGNDDLIIMGLNSIEKKMIKI